MNRPCARAAAAGALLVLIGACAPAPAVEAAGQGRVRTAGLCSAGETALFQCRIGGGQVAVCGGRSAAGRAYAQYRSGQPGALDMVYPAGRDSGAGNMVRASIPFSGGGEDQIHFTSGVDQTIVYSRTVRTGFSGTNNPRFSAGVAVRRNGRLVSNRGCSHPETATVDLGAAHNFIPEGEAVRFEE